LAAVRQAAFYCYNAKLDAPSRYGLLVHVILTIFPAMRMRHSCLRKQLFAVGSTTEVKYKLFKKQSSFRAPLVYYCLLYWSITATMQP